MSPKMLINFTHYLMNCLYCISKYILKYIIISYKNISLRKIQNLP